MKPLIYFDFKETDDENYVIVRKDRLQNILEEAYQAGYNDGFKTVKTPTLYPLTSEPTCSWLWKF